MTKNKDTKELIKLIIAFILIVAVEIGIQNLLALYSYKTGSDISVFLASFIIYIPMVAVAIIFTKSSGEKFWENCKFKKIKVSTVFLTILLAIVSFPIVAFMNTLSQLFVPNTVLQASGDLMGASGISVALYLISLIVLAPVFEEIIMRGFFHNKLSKLIPFTVAAIFSGFCFGVLHLNINQFCYAWVLGIIFAYLNRASGSIITSMIHHVTVNAIGGIASVLTSYAAKSQGVDAAAMAEAQRADSSIMVPTLAVLAVLTVIAFFLSRKIIKAIAKRETAEE